MNEQQQRAAARRAALECADQIAARRKAARLPVVEYHACKTQSFGMTYGLRATCPISLAI